VSDLPPLRYLSSDDVIAAMPPLPERLRLAELTLRGLAGAADLPPKIGVHPRAPTSFAHAMPAYLPGAAADGSADRLGMKWVLGFPANRDRGLPAIHGLVLLNDPVTGVPRAILDAGPITAERTAAVSGVVIRAYGPSIGGRAARVALIGAGVQGRSHVPVLGHLLPGLELRLFDRDATRAAELAAWARTMDGIGSVTLEPEARDAVADADVVVTAASFARPRAPGDGQRLAAAGCAGRAGGLRDVLRRGGRAGRRRCSSWTTGTSSWPTATPATSTAIPIPEP
jgi:ornithine cyclodeaminase/alanine dehydrogenase-like protein (mu-crystallin family)